MAFVDDFKEMLEARVRKFATGYAWAEDSPSRTRHLFTNVRVLELHGEDLTVTCNFILYRTRLEHDVDWWVGRREDKLRRDGEGFRIVMRTVYLDQTNMLAKNLSNFF